MQRPRDDAKKAAWREYARWLERVVASRAECPPEYVRGNDSAETIRLVRALRERRVG